MLESLVFRALELLIEFVIISPSTSSIPGTHSRSEDAWFRCCNRGFVLYWPIRLSMALELSRYLEENKSRLSPLLILAHDYPDPDALASAYALQYLAELKGGIHSRIVYGAVIGRIENQEMVRLLKIPARRSCRHAAGV